MDNEIQNQSPQARPQGWSSHRLLRLWFGTTEPVGRLAYATSGFALMLFKYGVEAMAIHAFTGSFLSPWDFLSPTLSSRRGLLQPGPEWLPWTIFIWTLPFLWIALTMSVRRAADAGSPPPMGLLMLVPLLNLLVMLSLCFLPSAPHEIRSSVARAPSDDDHAQSAALAIGAGVVVGGVMLWISVYLFSMYGASLFLGTPVLMGATASYLYNRSYSRSGLASMGIGVAAVFFAMCALLLFAFEGVICVAMAAPLVLPIGAMGGLIGKVIADSSDRSGSQFIGAILILPLAAWIESKLADSKEYVVLTTLDIKAPPSAVWNHVVDFPELTEPRDWYFNLGIACPLRARIDGHGPGATRYCEFTTGTFVEPITTWDEPRQLAFDVTDQPDPMIELSPYGNVRPPHLQHYLRSTHGGFRLIALPSGTTRLEGRTWYKFDMFPQWYWTLWSDMLIHRIHQRVLRHIQTLSEDLAASQ